MLTQKGSVAEYHEEFEKLAHAILLYNPAYDDTFFVTRFLEGLKEEVRSVIALHRPKDVMEASSLALMQEEVLNLKKDRAGHREFHKTKIKTFGDRGKITDADKLKTATAHQDSDDKLMALKDFRRKSGLCFKCGEKWAPNHTCPTKVSLHVIGEPLDAIISSDSDSSQPDSDELEEVITAVSHSARSAAQRRRTMKLAGRIGKVEILVLVDSGSVGTFVSNRLVDQLRLALYQWNQPSLLQLMVLL